MVLCLLDLNFHAAVLVLAKVLGFGEHHHNLLFFALVFVLADVSYDLVVDDIMLVTVGVEQDSGTIFAIDLDDSSAQPEKVHFILLYPFFQI